MNVSSATPYFNFYNFTGVGASGGGSVTRSNGYGLTDTAGLLAPGTTIPSFRDVYGNGRIFGSYDAGRFLPTNQDLLFNGFFRYGRDDITLGAITGFPAASAGSLQTDTYTFGGSFRYKINTMYLGGGAVFDFGHGNETINVDSSTGSFNIHGYSTDFWLGNVFMLLNTITSGNPGMPTKAPPKPAWGYAVGLDVSGHLRYNNQGTDGFTDSTGFIFGTGQTRYGDVGGRVKLFAIIPNNGWLWMPYVAGTVDQQFGFSSSLNIPNQAALAGGDLLSLQEAQTFLGTELGIDVHGPNGWTVGAKGFYQASTDTNIVGGRAFIKIPLDYSPKPAWGARY